MGPRLRRATDRATTAMGVAAIFLLAIAASLAPSARGQTTPGETSTFPPPFTTTPDDRPTRDPDGDCPCPLLEMMLNDYERLSAQAEGLGWIDDNGFIDQDAIIADVGQEKFDVCQAEAQDVNDDNVENKVREFYGLSTKPPTNNPEFGCQCFEGQTRTVKQLILLDRLLGQ